MVLRRRDVTGVAIAAAAVAAAAVTALLFARSEVLELPGMNAAVRSGLLLVVFGCALSARALRPTSRMWIVFLALGVTFATTTFQAFGQPAPYSIGRAILPLCIVLVLYAFLAHPSGRLTERFSRAAFVVAAAAMAATWLLVVLVASPLPSTGLLTTCAGTCPRNPFALGGGSPELVGDALLAVAGAQLVAAVAVTAAVALRLRRVPPVERHTLDLALVPLGAMVLAYAASFVLRAAGADGAVDDLGWVFAPLFAALAVALLIGQARGRMLAGAALRQALSHLGPHPDPVALERQMAEAFGDPSLRIAYRAAGGRYVDSAGAPIDLPAGTRPAMCELWDDGERVAVILSDHRLDVAAGFVEAATVLALRNARLSAELRSSVRALRESRARMSSAVDGARRDLERELAEGAQLELAIVRARLAEAAARVEDPASLALLGDLETAAEVAATTLDEAAHGIYPRELVEHGPVAALRARLDGIEVAGSVRRGPDEVEAAVFFACVEAAQNSLKHAGAASRVSIRMHERDGRLWFAVEDDGPGFDTRGVGAGHGLTHMRDRVEAVGGQLSVVSAPGRGTSITGDVPWRGRAVHAESPSGRRGHGMRASTRHAPSSPP